MLTELVEWSGTLQNKITQPCPAREAKKEALRCYAVPLLRLLGGMLCYVTRCLQIVAKMLRYIHLLYVGGWFLIVVLDFWEPVTLDWFTGGKQIL